MLKTAMVIVISVLLIVLMLFFALGIFSRSGEPLGLSQGRLLKCPNKPNCVCSEYKEEAEHFIEPVAYQAITDQQVIAIVKSLIIEMGGNIHSESGLYIGATFISAIFGFVDDLELRLDSEKNLIHLRSSSRVGYSDAGVNKKRTETFRTHFRKMRIDAEAALK